MEMFDICNCQFADVTLLGAICGPGVAATFMLMYENLLHQTCNIADPCSRLVTVEGNQLAEEYDFIVVGAGVAGAIVTRRLIEIEDWTVLLVEAGPQEPTATRVPFFLDHIQKTVLNWNYTTEVEEKACLSKGGVCDWPRGKTVGGTSVFNGMMYARGHPDDYERWVQEYGNEDWGWDDVFPYFLLSERQGDTENIEPEYHGYDGPLPIQRYKTRPHLADDIMQAAPELGYSGYVDVNGKSSTGFTVAQFIHENGIHTTTANAYLEPYRESPNLNVIIDAMVSRVVIDDVDGTKAASGVEVSYAVNGEVKTTLVKARKEVILSGGAVNSPQLLLLSGVGPRDNLEAQGIEVVQELPVGQNLQNHVGAAVSFTINDTSVTELDYDTGMQYIYNQTGPVATNGLTQVTAFLTSKYGEKDHADFQLFFNGYCSGCSRTGEAGECISQTKDCGRRPIIIRPTLLDVKSRGYLELGSPDYTDNPRIYPKYFSDPEDRDLSILVEGVKFAINLTQTDALKDWDFQLDNTIVEGCEDFAPPDNDLYLADDAYWRCAIMHETVPENHQSCSAKMGPADDPTSVVNSQLQVHGVPNIRVIDASVYPYVPPVNPIASIIMIAEKGSDLIREFYGQPTSIPK